MRIAPEDLRAELAGLTLARFDAPERMIHEGSFHDGRSAVVRALARRVGSRQRREDGLGRAPRRADDAVLVIVRGDGVGFSPGDESLRW